MIASRFTILCERRLPHYFVVEIHPTKRKMNAAAKNIEKQFGMRGKFQPSEAVCYSYKIEDRGIVQPELGTILFNADALHPCVLAHEFTHAAVTFCRRRKLNPMLHTTRPDDAEERLATCVGEMLLQFYDKQPLKRTFFVKGGGL